MVATRPDGRKPGERAANDDVLVSAGMGGAPGRTGLSPAWLSRTRRGGCTAISLRALHVCSREWGADRRVVSSTVSMMAKARVTWKLCTSAEKNEPHSVCRQAWYLPPRHMTHAPHA